ncbi:hypothetical protein PPL_06080 [Heterostelium album PN500]|uniref:Uncharacterized protein n=1 Tax=Heterostelium pallidum (strain ATCC 26659 / Pp 5 / PN500) TaxID=670386 RepID=D3BC58_HETP5|nr:hypothetical protein PPL_06080 [Heterostelium album PN500]EFA81241.1 hypothetical protein PPL_06080 [Heterostelium album PN500]|eukprot:XP_020433359.1 hypothetical protein PPL_06080 [Heterostelium album PN500]
MITPFHQQRKAGNTKILVGLLVFSAGVYFTSMWRMGQNDFKDINDFGFPVEEDKSKLQKRPRGSGSS